MDNHFQQYHHNQFNQEGHYQQAQKGWTLIAPRMKCKAVIYGCFLIASMQALIVFSLYKIT